MDKITLRDLRKQSGKTVAEIAKALNTTIRAIYNYENGIRRISLEQVLALSLIYQEPADEIITAQLNSSRNVL